MSPLFPIFDRSRRAPDDPASGPCHRPSTTTDADQPSPGPGAERFHRGSSWYAGGGGGEPPQADPTSDPRTIAAVMRSAPQPVVLFDDSGLIVDWSPAAERLLGYSRGEVVGRNLLALLFPARLHAAFETVIASHGAAWGEPARQAIEVTAVTRDGEEIPVEMTLSWASGAELFAIHLADGRQRGDREVQLATDARRRAAVNELGRMVLGHGDLERVLADIVAVAAEYAGLESCELWDFDHDTGELILHSAIGPRFGGALPDLRLKPAPGSRLAEALREGGEPIVFGDRLLPDPLDGPAVARDR